MLIDRPVMSLRTGGQVATTYRALINPNNLKIEGFYCTDAYEKKRQLMLVNRDIREVLPAGIVVDDHSVLVEPEELVRFHKVIEIDFELVGKTVVTEQGKKLGKVNDYATEPDSMIIKKLYITQTLIKNLTGGSISVDRTQIVEITNRKIVVKEPTVPIKSAAVSPVPAS
jgi:uncharacterized protein YrrD